MHCASAKKVDGDLLYQVSQKNQKDPKVSVSGTEDSLSKQDVMKVNDNSCFSNENDGNKLSVNVFKNIDAANITPSIATIKYPSGQIYHGEVNSVVGASRQRHGQGKLIHTATGVVYNGNWRNDRKHGKGTMQYIKGKYEGEWENNKPHGKGLLSYNGTVCEGNFQQGNLNGQAVVSHRNGDQTCGNWLENSLVNEGKIVYANEDTYEWKWDPPLEVGTGFVTMNYKNGDHFQGFVKQNLRHGPGRFKYACGHVYEGEFHEGAMSGKGTLHFRGGNNYEGEWKNNKFEGYGVYKDVKNSNTYEGHWKAGHMNGEGVMTYQNGDTWRGVWNQDKRVHGCHTFS